jgi:predicted nucleic acid-binding protein
MRYVLDASVALRWVLPLPLQPNALRVRADFQIKIHELLAPDIFIAEVAGALTKAERQKIIRIGRAAVLYADVMNTPPALHSHFPLVSRALAISSHTRSALLDCLYVALAEREGCELLTADDKLANNLKKHFSFIVPLKSMP